MVAPGQDNAEPENRAEPADTAAIGGQSERAVYDDHLPPAPIERQTGIIQVERSAPLPTPDELQAYEEILPGAAERIFRMAEAEQSHRVNRENRELDLQGSAIDYARTGVANQFKIGIMGSVFGFVLGLVGTVGGLALCWIGRWEAGLSAFFVALAVLVGLFLYEANARRAERRRATQPSLDP